MAFTFRIASLMVLCTLVIAAGCDRSDRSAGTSRDDASERDAGGTSPWHIGGGRYLIELAAGDDPEMQAAVAEAQRTADEARLQWERLDHDERAKWLIKWAAPIPESDPLRAEHLWVRPLTWSRFRIEGVLASAPEHDIGYAPGDAVAFPIEELADWVYKLNGTMDGPRQGGFTVDVLEKRYGQPNE